MVSTEKSKVSKKLEEAIRIMSKYGMTEEDMNRVARLIGAYLLGRGADQK